MFYKIISIVGSLTFLSRILGYIRDLLIARIIGAGMISDCFFVAFKLPNLFRRIFGEGAMNAAFIPVVSGIKSESGLVSSDKFFSKIFSILLVFLISFVVLAEISMPLIITLIAPGFVFNSDKFSIAIDLSRLAFPFVLFICLTSLMGAYLNTLGKFASMAVTPIILNLTLIFVLLYFFSIEDKLIISKSLSFAISIAGLIQVFWLYASIKRSKRKLTINVPSIGNIKKNSEISRFLNLLLPAILGNGAYQINLLIDMILASTLPDGSISYLYYADRINQLPLGVLGIAISTALLPVLSTQIKEKQFVKSNESISNAIKIGILLSVPAFIGLLIFSEEIIYFLFFRGAFDMQDVSLTSNALLALCFGLPAFIMIKILVVPFFASEDTKTPIKVSILCMVINLILNIILIRDFLHVGLAISTSVSAWINALILGKLLHKKLKFDFEKSILIVLMKVTFASFLMGVTAIKLNEFLKKDPLDYIFFGNNISLIMSIIFGILVYTSAIYILGIKELKLNKWKRQKKKQT